MRHANIPSGSVGKAEDPALKFQVDGARADQLRVRLRGASSLGTLPNFRVEVLCVSTSPLSNPRRTARR